MFVSFVLYASPRVLWWWVSSAILLVRLDLAQGGAVSIQERDVDGRLANRCTRSRIAAPPVEGTTTAIH